MQHRHASQPLCLPRRPLLRVVPIQGRALLLLRVQGDRGSHVTKGPGPSGALMSRPCGNPGGRLQQAEPMGNLPLLPGMGAVGRDCSPANPPFRRAAIRIFDACGLSLEPSSWVLLTMNPGPSRARGCWRSLGSPRPDGGFFRAGSFPKNSTHDISSSGGTQTPKKLAQAGGDSGDQQLQGEGEVLLVLDLGHDRHRSHGQRIVTTRDLGVAAHPGLVILGRFFTQ